ncbi:MAG: hypothetical protein ABH834_08040 [Candidatus Altiarchaeota archaeon]
MFSKGQSAIEWLITHSWSILLVLCVSAVLFYAGVFEATARPRFEGLASSGVQPVSEQVHLYSDGVLVLTVLNTRPYPIRLEWVEVAPIADREDVLRTDIGELISSGDIGVFDVNASNLLVSVGASVFFFPGAGASSQFVDFFICWNESYIVGGKSTSRVVCGKAWRIPYVSDPFSGGAYGGGGFTHPYPCDGPSGCPCYCLSEEDCLPNCEYCDNTGPCADESPFDPYNGCCWKCVDLCYPYGPDLMCKSTASQPDGECASIYG